MDGWARKSVYSLPPHPPPPPRRFVTRPRPIFASVKDGAGGRELRVFRGFSAIKTPTNHLQAGYRPRCLYCHSHRSMSGCRFLLPWESENHLCSQNNSFQAINNDLFRNSTYPRCHIILFFKRATSLVGKGLLFMCIYTDSFSKFYLSSKLLLSLKLWRNNIV